MYTQTVECSLRSMGHLGGGEAPALRATRPITEASQSRIPARKSSIGVLSPRRPALDFVTG